MTKEEALLKIEELKQFIEQEETKPTAQEMFWELILQTNSIKIDKKKYPNSTFGFKNDKFLWEYDSKNGYLWISYSLIWSVFEQEFNLNYQQIRDLIKGTVESHFNCKELTPIPISLPILAAVESHFNCKAES